MLFFFFSWNGGMEMGSWAVGMDEGEGEGGVGRNGNGSGVFITNVGTTRFQAIYIS